MMLSYNWSKWWISFWLCAAALPGKCFKNLSFVWVAGFHVHPCSQWHQWLLPSYSWTFHKHFYLFSNSLLVDSTVWVHVHQFFIYMYLFAVFVLLACLFIVALVNEVFNLVKWQYLWAIFSHNRIDVEFRMASEVVLGYNLQSAGHISLHCYNWNMSIWWQLTVDACALYGCSIKDFNWVACTRLVLHAHWGRQ